MYVAGDTNSSRVTLATASCTESRTPSVLVITPILWRRRVHHVLPHGLYPAKEMSSAYAGKRLLVRKTYHPACCPKLVVGATIGRSGHEVFESFGSLCGRTSARDRTAVRSAGDPDWNCIPDRGKKKASVSAQRGSHSWTRRNDHRGRPLLLPCPGP